jgi:hypothetical protein
MLSQSTMSTMADILAQAQHSNNLFGPMLGGSPLLRLPLTSALDQAVVSRALIPATDRSVITVSTSTVSRDSSPEHVRASSVSG